MAYRADIPLDSDQIRAGGDLDLQQDNFAALGAVALSGLNGLILGGANASGVVPRAQSSSSNALWFAQPLVSLDGFSTDNIRVSGTLQWDGSGLSPGVVISGTFAANQYARSDGNKLVPGVIIDETGIVVSGILQWDGAKLVPGHVISGTFVSGQLPRWDGAKFVPGVRIAQEDIATSGILQWDGDQFLPGRGISGSFVSGQYFKASGVAFRPALRFDTSTIPLSGVAQYDGAKITSGFAALLTGIAVEQLLSWDEAQGAFIPGSQVSGAAPPPTSVVRGEYLCHTTFNAGQIQSVPSNTDTLLSGCGVTRRNVGGFTVGSGTIRVPTGSGYTHAIVRAGFRLSGTADGVRQIAIQVSGGAQAAGAASNVYTYSGIPWATLYEKMPGVTTAVVGMQRSIISPLLPISGGETFSLWHHYSFIASQSVLGGPTGGSTHLQVQCFKLTSGGAS